MTRSQRPSHRPRRVNPIRRLKRKILGILADCCDACEIARENPAEFHIHASAILAHLLPIVVQMLESDLPDIIELESFNDMVSCLDLDVGEFIEFFPEQVERVIDACADYLPLQPYWAEMEPIMICYLHQMQGEVQGEVQGTDGCRLIVG